MSTTRTAPNVMNKTCPSRQALDLIADKWTVLVIYALRSGKRRYNELSRTVDGISRKMLTQTLRDLERNGMVLRTVYPGTPSRVDYRLTPLGERLVPLLSMLCDWAAEHMERVAAAQEAYDRAASRNGTGPNGTGSDASNREALSTAATVELAQV